MGRDIAQLCFGLQPDSRTHGNVFHPCQPGGVRQAGRAGPTVILFRVVLPLIKATIATVILYYAVAHWNSWFNASIFLRTRTKFPLQLVLREILIANDTTSVSSSGDLMGIADTYKQLIKYCTIIVSTMPVLAFYPFIMKYFKSGVMIGSIKG